MDFKMLLSKHRRFCVVFTVVVLTFLVLMSNIAFFRSPVLSGIRQAAGVDFNEQLNWAIKNIDAPTAWTQSTGTNIKIAILDSGITKIDDITISGGYNFINNNQDTTDQYGHGTIIASIIAATHTSSSSGFFGVAPDAKIYAVKIMDDQGNVDLARSVAGVRWAIDNGMQIISISWCITDQNNVLRNVLDEAYSKGILIVAAAGNNAIASGVGCPANYDSTIAVMAVNERNRQLVGACTGPQVELSAPGDSTNAIGKNNNLVYGVSGTSYAVPHIVGVAALIWAKNPTLTNTQVRNILCQTATDLQPNDGLERDIYFGYGLVNAAAAIQATPNDPNGNNNPSPSPSSTTPENSSNNGNSGGGNSGGGGGTKDSNRQSNQDSNSADTSETTLLTEEKNHQVINQINAPTAWTQSTGTNIKIAILDSGITKIDDITISGGYNFINNNQDTTDQYGHGTIIASIIAATHTNSITGFFGVAPDAKIYAVKIMDDQGNVNIEHAIAGIQWSIDNDMQIIVISWCINSQNSALKQAIDNAYSKGILIVTATGNVKEIPTGIGYPAEYSSTMAVSAIKKDNQLLEESCIGTKVELVAPGENLYVIGADNKEHVVTGTSYAASYVAGTAALVWAKNPTLTNTQVRSILCQTATKIQSNSNSKTEKEKNFESLLVNAATAVQAAQNFSDTPNNSSISKTTTTTIILIVVVISIISGASLLKIRYNKTKTLL